MKIVSWNCSGGFRKKFKNVEVLNPDIIIIQECENPEKYHKDFLDFSYNTFIWEGESENKGIGIFYKSNYNLKKLNWNGNYTIKIPENNSKHLNWTTNELRQFLPVSLTIDLNILAVWTKGNKNQTFEYIGQFWKFILANKEKLLEKPSIIIGDFNSNKKWDKIDRWWNHSEVINILDSWNYKSLYHELYLQEQGNEQIPTFYLHRNREKPYHIDYVFLPKNFIGNTKFEIGKFDEWIKLSDHMPLIVEINTK
ncbi:endonuclease/exonuclease/phosphatase family protein [Leptospira bandrabouensis]|uniref:endonuclease/exonuclease/phosphatase family protein n=1 Tax=Leptospira bandrabouensis TaxID=2484903 RepID=UPI001EE965DA|nr:endonuclease/exonuclease/phosphatase family protein [Leptospira bandrabouensis]MCG6146560.1 endonuclease/exonuclease/phosphatase family protein [Leptospira bandrabouensis]MCG6162006.1 endonuclease/exonuclease/phosphatase family protein [Leptospira bandrabouensis]MCG6166217.1 endonuclease/exonuclease/phosphatase family protein [Leptospira bandrabouensis]